jgi:hypothetical protein
MRTTRLKRFWINSKPPHTWVPQFQELQKLVETHVAAEENEMFPKTEAIMTPQEAEELGVAVASAKEAISRNADDGRRDFRAHLNPTME